MKIVHPRRLEKALIAHGLIPPYCRLIDVVIHVNEAPKVRYEILLDDESLRKFADAFAEAAKDDG
jgi:hypothetical protein